MSGYQFRNDQRGRPDQKKKPNTGLIIGLVVGGIILLIVIIIIIILVRRKKTVVTPPSTNCKTAGCPSGKHCNTGDGNCYTCLVNGDCSGSTPKCETSSHTCVTCLADGDCSAGQTCNTSDHTCHNPTCTTNANCTTPAIPVCVSGTCQQCTLNADCSGNTLYSTQGKNKCNGSNTCVQCNVLADCPTAPNATCTAGVCCDTTPPTITGSMVTATTSTNSSISGSYTPTNGTTAVIKLQAPATSGTGSITGTTLTITAQPANAYPFKVNQWVTGTSVLPGTQITALGTGTGGVGTYIVSRSQTVASTAITTYEDIFSTTPSAPTGSIILTQSGSGKTFYPGQPYAVMVKLTRSCGDFYSPAVMFSMPACGSNPGPSMFNPPSADVNTSIKGFRINTTASVPVIDGMVVTKIPGLHPNLVVPGNGHVVRNINGVGAGFSVNFTALWSASPPLSTTGISPDVVAGQTWYARAFHETDGNCISALSGEVSAVVAP